MSINFTPKQVLTLKALLAEAESLPRVADHNGRSGHRFSRQNLKKWDPALLRTILNEEIQHAVLHYFAGSRELVLYSVAMLYTATDLLAAGAGKTQTNKHSRELRSGPSKRKAEESAVNLKVKRSRNKSDEPA